MARTVMQRQAALRQKAFEDVHGTYSSRVIKLSPGSAARGTRTAAKRLRRAHKRFTRPVKPFRFHV